MVLKRKNPSNIRGRSGGRKRERETAIGFSYVTNRRGSEKTTRLM